MTGADARTRMAETWRQERSARCPLAPARVAQPAAATDSKGAPIKKTVSSRIATQVPILSVRRRSGFLSRPSLRASRLVFIPGTRYFLAVRYPIAAHC
jgi:hypothetical protein